MPPISICSRRCCCRGFGSRPVRRTSARSSRCGWCASTASVTCCSATCSRVSDAAPAPRVRDAAKPGVARRHLRDARIEILRTCPEFRRIRRSEISPLPSGITAHCYPSLCGDLPREAFSIIAGDVHAKPNRETRVNRIRQRSCRHSLQHLILQCNAGAGRLPFGTQCSNARGQSLVLSHLTWHQAPLLVSPPGGRKGLAERPVELPGFRQADCAEARTGDPGFGRECPRRTVASANTRHGGQHRATAAGTRPECRQFHGPPACHCPGYQYAAATDGRFPLARAVKHGPV